MQPASRHHAFLPLPNFFAVPTNLRTKLGSVTAHRRPRFNAAHRRSVVCVIPQPDDAAVDMLTFALSGPGILAAAGAVISGFVVLFSFAEIGPRKRRLTRSYFIRITLPKSHRVDLPDGRIVSLREGETVLTLPSLEACNALGRSLEVSMSKRGLRGIAWAVYQADGTSIKSLSQHPRRVNVAKSEWPSNVVDEEDKSQLQARWEEYERIGATDAIDSEWTRLMRSLSPIKFKVDDCRLCGGAGYVKCHRCGGVGTSGNFQCNCSEGKLPCEWCTGS